MISTRASAPRSSTRATLRGWNPATLEEVDPVEIERYFAPLGAEELVL